MSREKDLEAELRRTRDMVVLLSHHIPDRDRPYVEDAVDRMDGLLEPMPEREEG